MFVLLTNNFPFDESYSRSFNCFYPTQFRMTKCTFHKYGTSGNIENHDVLCILPLNIGKTRTHLLKHMSIKKNYVTVNEKIYIFIWFWFLALSLLSFAVVLYRFIIIFSPYIRAYVLRMRFRLVRDNHCFTAGYLTT